MPCPIAGNCGLSVAITNLVALRVWERKCCQEGDAFQQCARFKLAARGCQVPASMLPNGHMLAFPEP